MRYGFRMPEPLTINDKKTPPQVFPGEAFSVSVHRGEASGRFHCSAYLTLRERPMRSVVRVVMPFSSQSFLTVVWCFAAIEPSVSPERIL